ncbi:MAG: 16S rRNA (uracil(1498)-N(3))-methyltransferase [Gammaproteobacteria bacterium]|nr:16S rRNA (uracil(1498)-N(3))-methyltransferase [Gammaproteobacteria bacterium]MCW8986912.1 16S rRNA (uracil(1498)-N(3))-methyltransferase [Gammaproteobacteria bacterium]
MRIPRIYQPSPLTIGQSVELSEHAFQHAIKVLRLKPDSKLILFNGEGAEFSAMVEIVNKKNAFVTILESINLTTESNLEIHLGLGISKGERMDYAIQKAVELGVTKITPLFTEHCVVNLDEKRIQKRLQHWQGIMISACEQCGRSVLPALNTTASLLPWAETVSDLSIIFDPLASATLRTINPENNKLNLIIGPEGGLSSHEISELIKKSNFHAVKFGPRILRTETAAVSAITAAQILWGDLLQ